MSNYVILECYKPILISWTFSDFQHKLISNMSTNICFNFSKFLLFPLVTQNSGFLVVY